MNEKNEEIEALRAVAVLLTCVHHVGLLLTWNKAPLGITEKYFAFWGGVDLFFCISGYVVSRSFMESFDRAKADGRHWEAARAFWVRRAYRLLPSSWFWILATAVCATFLNQSGAFANTYYAVRSGLTALLFSANFGQFYGLMYPNWAHWSLSLEEQFYFAFPLILLVTTPTWRWRLALLAIAIMFPLARGYPTLGWFLRIDALLWGILIYMVSRTAAYRLFEPIFLRTTAVAWLASVALLTALIAIPKLLLGLPFYVGLMAVVSALLIFAASFQKGYVLPFRRLKPAALWLGSRSYAIYLCHLPAYFATVEIWHRITVAQGQTAPDGTYTLRFILTAVALTGLLAELNYRFLEVPFRNRARKALKADRQPVTTPTAHVS